MYYIVFWDKECHIQRPVFWDWDDGVICVYPNRKVAQREAATKHRGQVLPYHGSMQPTRNPELLIGPIDTVWPNWQG